MVGRIFFFLPNIFMIIVCYMAHLTISIPYDIYKYVTLQNGQNIDGKFGFDDI